jgi:hypothetical protein
MIPAAAIGTWRELAACAGQNPEMFFLEADTQAAKLICHACRVREACLAEALLEEAGLGPRHRFGVRGGSGPAARAGMASAAGLVKRPPAQRVTRRRAA